VRPSMHECGTRYQASDGAAQRTPGNPLVLDGDDLSAGLGVDEAARLVAKRGDVHWFGNEEVVVVGVRTVPEGVERRMVDGCRRNQAERPHIVARRRDLELPAVEQHRGRRAHRGPEVELRSPTASGSWRP